MRNWTPTQLASAAGARLLAGADARSGPDRAVIDSRQAGPGALFVGLPGASVDGGAFATEALAAGAWGVLTRPEHARRVGMRPEHAGEAGAEDAREPGAGVWMTAEQPLQALQRLATAWRRELGAQVIGVTGSTGKTSTKDLLRAVLRPQRRVVASRANFNTEIGLPLELLTAPAGTEVVVLEMGMRGAGQIAELAAIAEPDVAVIVSIGPVHVELLGGIPQIAAAKAELIAALKPGGTAVIPAGEPLLGPHLRGDVHTVTFGDGGDVRLLAEDGERLTLDARGQRLRLEVDFAQAHLRRNLLAAVAAAQAVGVTPEGRIALELSPGRGQLVELPHGVTLIDDSYNANPMSMQAALDHLGAIAGSGRRRVAVLGDMLELGPTERDYHAELGRQARDAGVELLIAVGPLAAVAADAFAADAHRVADATAAAERLGELLAPGDVVLVKGSRGVGLETVCHALQGVVA